MADSRTLEKLRDIGVAEASFHANGKLASVKFVPMPFGLEGGNSAKIVPFERDGDVRKKTDLDVLSDLPSFEDIAG